MSRIPRVSRLQSLHATSPITPTPRAPFVAAAAFSTSTAHAQRGPKTLRQRLWRGDVPGSNDPYTERPAVEESNLPVEAKSRPQEVKVPYAVRTSRIALPPVRSEAVSEKELPDVDPTYAPAESIDDLVSVPPLSQWWHQKENWGEESVFRGFGNPAKTTDKNVVEVYLRRAVVEALALKQTGLIGEWSALAWPQGGRTQLDQVLALELQTAENGEVTIAGDVSTLVAYLTGELPEEMEVDLQEEFKEADIQEEVREEKLISWKEAREIAKPWDASWQNLVLDDELKFAIRKRLFQLTGTLLSDARLGAARTVKHVLSLASKPPPAKKLAESLQKRADVRKLANVTVHPTRRTMVHKEKAIGRWKVIQEELELRGLPSTGTKGYSGNDEKKWINGRA